MATRAEASDQPGADVNPRGNGQAEPGFDPSRSRKDAVESSFDLQRLLRNLCVSDGRHSENNHK